MRGDGTGGGADPEQAHGSGRRVHQNRDILGVEDNHPDPERIKAKEAEAEAEAAGGAGKPAPGLGGCGFGCLMLVAAAAVLYFIGSIIGLLIPG